MWTRGIIGGVTGTQIKCVQSSWFAQGCPCCRAKSSKIWGSSYSLEDWGSWGTISPWCRWYLHHEIGRATKEIKHKDRTRPVLRGKTILEELSSEVGKGKTEKPQISGNQRKREC